jgi:hypothetical protein
VREAKIAGLFTGTVTAPFSDPPLHYEKLTAGRKEEREGEEGGEVKIAGLCKVNEKRGEYLRPIESTCPNNIGWKIQVFHFPSFPSTSPTSLSLLSELSCTSEKQRGREEYLWSRTDHEKVSSPMKLGGGMYVVSFTWPPYVVCSGKTVVTVTESP